MAVDVRAAKAYLDSLGQSEPHLITMLVEFATQMLECHTTCSVCKQVMPRVPFVLAFCKKECSDKAIEGTWKAP